MSLVDFQTKYSSFVEGMVRSAINETTKLFETIIDELKEELSKTKKECEELKAQCNRFEVENKRLSRRAETKSAFVQTTGVEARDEAVQCDLICVPAAVIERPQFSTLNQQCSSGSAVVSPTLQHQSLGATEEESQMTETFVIKEEESDCVLVSKHLIRDTADNVPVYVLSVEHCQPLAKSIQTHRPVGSDEAMFFLQDHQYCGLTHPSLKTVKQEEEEWHYSTVKQESDDDAAAASDIGTQTDQECLHLKDNTALSKLESTDIQEKRVEAESQMDPNGPRVVSVESLSHTYSSVKRKLNDTKQHVKPADGRRSPSITVETQGETSIPLVEHNTVPLQDAMLLVEAMNQQLINKLSSPTKAVELRVVQSTANINSQNAKELLAVGPGEAPKISQKNVVKSDKARPVILSVEPISQNISKLSDNTNPSMLRCDAAAHEAEANAEPLQKEPAVSDKPLTRCLQEASAVSKCPETGKSTLHSTDPEPNVMPSEISSSHMSASESRTSVSSRKAYLVSRLSTQQSKEGSPAPTKISHISQMQPVVVIRIPRLPTPDIDNERWTTHSSGFSSSGITTEENLSPAELSSATSSPVTDNSEASDTVPSKIMAPLSEESMDAMDLCEFSEATEPQGQVESEPILRLNRPIKQELQAVQISPLHKKLQVPQLHMTKAQFLAQLAVGPTGHLHEKPLAEAENSIAETPTSRKKKSPNTSFVARLRSHLKSHLQEKRTKAITDCASETEALPVSPKKAKLESEDVTEVNNATEPVSQRKSKVTQDVASSKSTTPHHLKTKSCKESPPVIKFTWRTLTLSQNADSQDHRRDSVSSGKGRLSNSSIISEKSHSGSFTKKTEDGPEGCTVASKRLSSVKSQSAQCASRSGTSQCSSSKENTSPKRYLSTKEGVIPNCELVNPQRSTRDQTVSLNNTTGVSQNAESDSAIPRRTSNRIDKDDHLAQMAKPSSLRLKKSRSSNGCSETDSSCADSLKPSPTTDVLKTSAAGSTNLSPKKVSFSQVLSKIHETGETTNFEAYMKNGLLWTKVTNDNEVAENVNENKRKAKVSLKVAVAKKASKAEAKRKYSGRSRTNAEEKTTVVARNRRRTMKKNESATKSFKTERKSLELAATPRQNKAPSPHNKSDRASKASPSGGSQTPKGAKHQCMECGRILCSKVSLESHANLHIGQRPYPCTVCSKTFPDARSLKRHERVHHNNRRYVCLECGKGFVYQFGLTKHTKMVHTRFKPFVCQICNKAFFTKQEVEAHIRRHTGETPFHCTQCDKKFTKKVELIVHMRWHSGEKRHWCPYCGKGFVDYNNLKRHKYIHTGEKPQVCPYCQKRFTQSSHVKKHIRNVHKMPTNV
ncbi:uncharacterized protein LOC128753884 isoform X1 [Synchiropus splendidus]|uniref:uncharacterized protein LOC128753884 isoform X1 n=1 Tax=Synchiropus splendidus TaxID=270530 RepID=UPI00237EA37C|nr:uncharacterized protein LOC128753884 isoform X1 [Synchiropus splendidus]